MAKIANAGVCKTPIQECISLTNLMKFTPAEIAKYMIQHMNHLPADPKDLLKEMQRDKIERQRKKEEWLKKNEKTT